MNKAQCNLQVSIHAIHHLLSMATFTVAMHGFRALRDFCSEKPLHLRVVCELLLGHDVNSPFVPDDLKDFTVFELK